VDHLTHSRKQLEYVIELVGEGRVCFGSDYPFPLGECYPLKKPGQLIDELVGSGYVDAAAGRRLLGRNTLEWLGLTAEPFLASPHRASKLDVAHIVARHHAPFAGRYMLAGAKESADGTLDLRDDGSFVWLRTAFDGSEEGVYGEWHVGT